ncbi:MBL fold metallo-hydrolase [Metabacillus arenae]|uniref:MBL fold metallo-hydrolase n=1 Tax=Metabacillus arenae TaxID=2771434 RepID=A0A926RVU6_9BACI|nr:MBL fold metallo-hydrolase [Metabacillus arenae]MBD1378875.1 MBL fold metallo-hydrolase [Metabacillus arenae]
MNWVQIPLGPLQTNAYILSNKEKDCVIFDPGSEGDKVNQYIQKEKLNPLAILLTHAHFDHIGGVDDVRKKWCIPVYIHEEEKDWLTNPELNGSTFFLTGGITAKPADHLLKGDQTLTIQDFTFSVYETPGHSPGSVSFYHKESQAVFSGDALFAGSIGRTDLRGGNHEQLIKSIHEKLLTLPEETIVLSGHGPETSIEKEMEQNPFLNGF